MDKAIASMLGGAIGDALGVTQEIFPCSRSLVETHEQVMKQRKARTIPQQMYEGGGPWQHHGLILKPGEWTDDTSMMLCLADSILRMKTVDNGNLMKHFIAWWFHGYNSCNGKSLGLGGNTKNALNSFNPREPSKVVGGTDPRNDAGNGAIMRLAPVPIYWHETLDLAIDMAYLQAATTHNVSETRDGSALMTFIIWHALNGYNKDYIFNNLNECAIENEEIKELMDMNASWRTKTEDDIITLPGRCLWTLEAALWCVYHTNSFKDAVIKAVNLGGDADTVGSVTGQIAGAIYGLRNIPHEWLDGLHHRREIELRAIALYTHDNYSPAMMLQYEK